MSDKYSAVWVSHSSMRDFTTCPRAYFLNNVYKDPKTGHKISIVNPHLVLGSVVHEVIENLSTIPTSQRFEEPLSVKFEQAWKKFAGKLGGFRSDEQEYEFKQRGIKMLKTVQDNPGPLENLAIKINMDLPHFWLDEAEEIILCGKIDWLEYLPEDDSVHIIDFKTGKKEEASDSLQLPIYHLLVANCQGRKATKASYWYLEQGSKLTSKKLPNLEKSKEKVLKIAKQIKLARKLNRFKCPGGADGCPSCRPLEQVISGQAEFVGISGYNQDTYVIHNDKVSSKEQQDSFLL